MYVMQIKTSKEGKRLIFVMKPKLTKRFDSKYVSRLYATSRGLNKSTIRRLANHGINLNSSTFFEIPYKLDTNTEIMIEVYRTTLSVAKEVMNHSCGFANYEWIVESIMRYGTTQHERKRNQ